ncbi:MAG: sodium-dependent transporter [Thermodesulfovibrionales bacterium]|nr:sodium-dependent transporter [Thermodesulfovibrionales bacterium]
MASREHWRTKTGLVLAMAGSAIGLGNFLRFPTQAAQHGGGIFMIPYMISLILIAIPLLWIEWAMGRYGGIRGHGTTPAIFNLIWKNPLSKYLGVFGLFVPFVVCSYYIYIESWTLGYAIFSILGGLPALPSDFNISNEVQKPFKDFFLHYTGFSSSGFLNKPVIWSYLVFVVTCALNYFVLIKGVSKGIERFCKFAMPLLFLMGIFLAVRIFFLQTNYGSAVEGLNFLWEPRWDKLTEPAIWLAAAGQVFFTLSLGFGAIIVYASYLKRNDDITLTSLTSASLNEFAEVVLGASIAIPAAVAFFGLSAAQEIAKTGSFTLAFISLPVVFASLPYSNIISFIWFFLLFLAGITSSIAITQPIIAFLEDELKFSKNKAVTLTFTTLFLVAHLPIFLPFAIDEMDFWAGTFLIVAFGFIQSLIFLWSLTPATVWTEINRGGSIKLPKIFFLIMKYITPAFLGILTFWWIFKELPSYLQADDPRVWITRVVLFILLSIKLYLIFFAYKKKKKILR